MSEVIWLPEALADIERLYAFLTDKNPQAARNAILCIQAAARQLETFPEIGRPMRDDSPRREIFAAFGAGAYVLRYRLNDTRQPAVIRVWHTREWRQD
ncbi:MAG: type II toxin-antitoxin system RelE/ParE family toxin [Gallionellaceae bacterium]|nr:type II toxin-antitoxin system RelE/ParE family toxin [Gallionellaceae bacterium]